MYSTMTTKRVLLSFILLTIFNSAFAQVGETCVIKFTNTPGTCKIARDCPLVQEQAEKGISPTICGYYHLTVPIVCCEDAVQQDKPKPIPNPNTFLNPDALVYPEGNMENPPGQVESRLSKSEEKCTEYSKSITGIVQAIPLVTNTEAVTIDVVKCDYNGVPLIVGGKPAVAGEFPFMAAIGFAEDNKIAWLCGGTLISEDYVLTAAHCTYTRDSGSPQVIRLGDLDLTRTDDGSVHSDYGVRNVTVHPKYRYPLKYYDIALIQLSSKARFTKYIRPACLYTKTQIELPQAVATGWGKTDYAASEISERLMKVALNLYKNERCAQTYQSNKHLPEGIKSNMICAGELSGGMDTCQGDSGGPLLITKLGNHCKFYVIGITSFGKSCGQVNTPAIYTRVSSFVPWIEKIIWQ